jgi:hypothetical protein
MERNPKDEFARIWSAIGIISGSLSIIGLLQKCFVVHLLGVPNLIVEYYHLLLLPVKDALSFVIHVQVPQWLFDIFVLSFVSAVTFVRAWHSNTLYSAFAGPWISHQPQFQEFKTTAYILETLAKILLGSIFLTLILLLVVTTAPLIFAIFLLLVGPFVLARDVRERWFGYPPPSNTKGFEALRLFYMNVLLIFIAVVAFFVWNSSIR